MDKPIYFFQFQVKNHKESLTGIAVSVPLGKATSCGDNTVKIHELHDLKDTYNVINIDDERGLDNVEWSEDGQLLAVSTSKGNLHVYLSKLPLLGSGELISAIWSIVQLVGGSVRWLVFCLFVCLFFH